MTMVLSRRDLLVGATTAAASSALAVQATAQGSIDLKALQNDADILQGAFLALHPGLYRYNTQADINAHFRALRSELAACRGIGDAHLAFARLAAEVRCGHTFLNPANQEAASLALNTGGRSRLPFRFRWIAGRMIVTRAPVEVPAITAGCKVMSWNGVSTSRLLTELMRLAPADGGNDAKRRRLMELWDSDDWQLFDIYVPLLHPELVQDGVARLTVRDLQGQVTTVDVPLLTRQQRLEGIPKGVITRGSAEPAWRLERLPNGAGWLTMRSWAVFDSRWDWKAALNTSLDELVSEKAPALVLDLRGNAGGLDVGDVILSRLVDRDVRKTSFQRFTRYRQTPADLDRYLKTWDTSFRDWGDNAIGPNAEGLYRLIRFDDDPGGDLIRPEGKRFKGKLIVLIDASNSSATFGFAEALKTAGLATLIGETTGGSRRGINGGAFFFLQLPGSGLEMDIPLIGTFPTTPQPDAGIDPDVSIITSVEDIAAQGDVTRDAAIRLVQT